jgi:hypothetical protein
MIGCRCKWGKHSSKTRITINIDETPFSVHKSTIGTKIVIEHGFSSVGYNTSKSFVC